MYLKSIEIHGFKSFGEEVNIEFSEGITSIIGPNGSGKSNILDAVLWVLGEQAYKNIRAKESSDVIFSGGNDIKQMNFAQVSLIMDNTDRYFPMELDTIKITRRLTAKKGSLENEYYINDKKARLKDIGTMFLDTGVGKTAYSVIGQGRVERIISSSPKEIKGIIEEAAGIKKLQQQKSDAIKNLSTLDTELGQINFQLDEIKKSRDTVGKQAEKAVKFVEIRDERDSLGKGIYLVEYSENKNKLKVNSSHEEILTKSVEDHQQNLEQVIKRIDEIGIEKGKISHDIGEMDEKNKNLNDDISKMETEKSVQEERIVRYQDRIKNSNDSIKTNETRILEKDEQIKRLEEEKIILDIELENLSKTHEEISNDLEKYRNLKDVKDKYFDEKNKTLGELEFQKAKQQYDMNSVETSLENSKKTVIQGKKDLEECEKKIEEISRNLELKKSDFLIRETLIQEKEARRNYLSGVTSETSKKTNETRGEIASKKGEYEAKKSRLNNLIRADESNEGYQRGVREVLNSSLDGIEGTFVSLVNIPEKYEVAIMAGAGGNMQDIVVPTSDVAKKAIQLLNDRKAGKASFLALDTIKVNPRKNININMDGIIGLASTVVKSDIKYERVVEFVLGNMLIVESLEVGLKVIRNNIFSGSVVTLSGELLSARGRITGGTTQNKSKGNEILERKREIKTLEESLKILEEELQVLEELLVRLDKEVKNIEEEEEVLKRELGDVNSELANLNKECNEYMVEKEGLGHRKNNTEAILKNAEDSVREYEGRLNKNQSEWELLEDQIAVFRVDLEEVDKEVQKLGEELKEKEDSYRDISINYENKKNQRNSKNRSTEDYSKEKNSFILENTETKNRIKNEYINIEVCEKEIKELMEKIDNLTKKYESENQDIISLKKSSEDLGNEEKKLNDSRLSLEREHQKKVYELEKTTNTIKKLEEELEKLSEELKPLEEIKPKKIDSENLKDDKENYKKLDLKVKTFGDVNVLAIEEFKNLNERYTELNTHRDDLVNGKDKLMELMGEIDGNIQEKFFKAYNEINANFNIMCEATLNNSEGKLELINPENFDECGVEIFVKFKNKKRQSLSLLSGGEKSMVAIAFVISIFMYKPSPFTFLDEIEAALDETNTTKLLNKLREFVDKSQFILITHNKTTMSKSDTLLGVSMNKDIGITKIVGVNPVSLDDYLRHNKGTRKVAKALNS